MRSRWSDLHERTMIVRQHRCDREMQRHATEYFANLVPKVNSPSRRVLTTIAQHTLIHGDRQRIEAWLRKHWSCREISSRSYVQTTGVFRTLLGRAHSTRKYAERSARDRRPIVGFLALRRSSIDFEDEGWHHSSVDIAQPRRVNWSRRDEERNFRSDPRCSSLRNTIRLANRRSRENLPYWRNEEAFDGNDNTDGWCMHRPWAFLLATNSVVGLQLRRMAILSVRWIPVGCDGRTLLFPCISPTDCRAKNSLRAPTDNGPQRCVHRRQLHAELCFRHVGTYRVRRLSRWRFNPFRTVVQGLYHLFTLQEKSIAHL